MADEYWYVSAVSGPRRALLLGPYALRDDAEGNVDRARRTVLERFAGDMEATFAGFGVARLTGRGDPPQGRLQRLGVCALHDEVIVDG